MRFEVKCITGKELEEKEGKMKLYYSSFGGKLHKINTHKLVYSPTAGFKTMDYLNTSYAAQTKGAKFKVRKQWKIRFSLKIFVYLR